MPARIAHVVWSERAGVSACGQCLPVLKDMMVFVRAPTRNPRSQARLIFLITHARVLRIRDSRFSFQSGASIKIQPV